jgi:hypothetical protein
MASGPTHCFDTFHTNKILRRCGKVEAVLDLAKANRAGGVLEDPYCDLPCCDPVIQRQMRELEEPHPANTESMDVRP